MIITITVDDSQAALLDAVGLSIPGYVNPQTFLTDALNSCAQSCIRRALASQIASLPDDQLSGVVTAAATAVAVNQPTNPVKIKP